MEKVVDFLSCKREIFRIKVLKELIIVVKSSVTFTMTINTSKSISDIDLAQFILAMHLKLILELQKIFKKFAQLHMSLIANAHFCLLI